MLDKKVTAAAIASDIAKFSAGKPDPNDPTKIIIPDASGSYINDMMAILDTGFQAGSVSQASVDISVVAGTLSMVYAGNSTFAADLGAAVEAYWVAAVGIGTPQSLANVDSVTNDAVGIGVKIEANILALAATSGYSTPYYEAFVDAIFKEVLKIKWTVSESTPPASSTYTVTIS